MTMNNSMDSQAFDIFIEKFFSASIVSETVVVMDNLPARKYINCDD